jgi:S1-C subfamily serine protease
MESTSRRGFLAGLGATGAATLAGCSSEAPRSDTAGRTPAGEGAFERVYRETIPSVAQVRTYGPEGVLAEGSAFVYGGRTLVTNEHVVAGADRVRVQFRGGEWRTASIAGTDAYSDLAALQVPDRPAAADPLELVPAQPAVGTQVIAVGAPFGFGGSVSTGVVSGQDRSLPGPRGFSIADAVQTDAAVNPGNSGGPLVTLSGAVAGVVSAGGGDNVGFAISAAMVRRVVPALIRTGSYEHPYVGVRLRDLSPTIAAASDLERARGIAVVSVVDGGPADGILHGSERETTVDGVEVPVGGDVIRRLEGTETPDLPTFSALLATEARPGERVDLGIVRDGTERTTPLTLGTRPPP